MSNAELLPRQVESAILHRVNFEPSLGCTFGHLLGACKLTYQQDRVLDKALQRLRKRGVIRFAKITREWVIA